jgi:hypothetical protein
MEQKATTKEVNKLQEVASCRKSISETTILLREKIQLLTVLFDKLTISERNLIGEELMEVFGNSMRTIHDISQNLEVPVKTSVAKVLFTD